MRSSTRSVVLAVLAGGLVILQALPALAKGVAGEDPVVRTVVLFGPNMQVPAVFQGQAALDFARDSGILDAANAMSTVALMAPPAASALGPRYSVTYVIGFDLRMSLHLDGDSVTQDLYPYATGGAVAVTAPEQGLHASGWWRVAPNLMRQLRAAGLAGLPEPFASAAGSSAAPGFGGPTWALWVALAVVDLIGLLDTGVVRRRRAATTSG